MRALRIAVVFAVGALAAHADLRLPALFSDGMVLQAETPIPVWGWAAPGERVEVRVDGASRTAIANEKGGWRVDLPPLRVTGQATRMVVTGRNEIVIGDVLVGEVWLASGQSNMAVTLETVRDAASEMASADFPSIRVFVVERAFDEKGPRADCSGRWIRCSPATASRISAVAYYFAREMHRETGRPTGLIVSAWGATAIQSWTSRVSQETKRALIPVLERKFATSVVARGADYEEADRKNGPGVIFNAMIAPLAPFALRGVIWYHGENNTRDVEFARLYGTQLGTLVEDWRRAWAQPWLPFAWVQLPAFSGGGRPGWSVVREQMRRALSIPRTGMAVTNDIGDAHDLHPPNKRPVGERLAAWALATVHGSRRAPSGPLVEAVEQRQGALAIRFLYGDGLQLHGPASESFELSAADGEWRTATARVEGGELILTCAAVPNPTAARYAWPASAEGVLFNGARLPASPFVTVDDRAEAFP